MPLPLLALYRLAPVTAGQLALREFARRRGEPAPVWAGAKLPDDAEEWVR